jgi:hypothetical protein
MTPRFSITLRLSFLLSLLLLLFLSHPILAQTSPPASREALTEQIKTYAARHAKTGTAMQTQLVVSLFSNNVQGLTQQDIALIYEEEYTKIKDASKPSPWAVFSPNTGWPVAGIFMLLLIFRDIIKDWLTRQIKAINDKIFRRFAGKPFFWNSALKRYQKALLGKHAQLHIPFRPNRPLGMRETYVPLKASGSTDAAPTEALRALRQHRRLAIKGPPGSGKSMLLKRIALSYAEGRLENLPGKPIPILLELHRFNDPKSTFEDLLVSELARNDFPNAANFISNALNQGSILVLLDGLDEVSSSERKRVVQQIKDSLHKYNNCRAVITCRSIVYRNEFEECVTQTLELIEFDDQQIRLFLSSWSPEMTRRERSIEHLMHTLHSRPRIMALARNPLLLTIIAYLYTDTEFALPHSRAEFYRKSTDILLDLWHQEHNRFKASDKRLILQHLALFNQDAAATQGQDRLTMRRPAVLEQVRKILPELNLKPESADTVLDEIVERSGLLLVVDGGEGYQFAHLTLQEYFAATKLTNDAKGLQERFKADHDAWRETVKLWCGLDHDSTGTIRAIHAEESVTAFESLADAQQVHPDLATEILDEFRVRLGLTTTDDAIIRAFGTVASDMRPRGEAVLNSLRETLATAETPMRRIAAANAISQTNLPNAAQMLAEHYSEPKIRAALVKMGDLAVPSLVQLVTSPPSAIPGTSKAILSRKGKKAAQRNRLVAKPQDVMDDLLRIGTPLAAAALVPWLWHESKDIATIAAWRLAALLHKPGVEDVLRIYSLDPSHRGTDFLDWVWKPFEDQEDSPLTVIAGRVALLLGQASAEFAPAWPQTYDPRLAIPLCVIQKFSESGMPPNKPSVLLKHADKVKSILEVIEKKGMQEWIAAKRNPNAPKTEDMADDVNEVISILNPSAVWRLLFRGLPLGIQAFLIGRLIIGMLFDRIELSFAPTKTDWINIFRPAKFNKDWNYRIAIAIPLALSGFAILSAFMLIGDSPEPVSWSNALLFAAAIAIALSIGTALRRLKTFNDAEMLLLSAFFGPFVAFFGATAEFRRKALSLKGITIIVILFAWLPSIVYPATIVALKYFSWRRVVVIWVLLLVGTLTLWFISRRRDRNARNPLQGIIQRLPSRV